MRRLVIILLCTLLAGCGKNAAAPPSAASGVDSPVLLATQPSARATSAAYDGEIWAQFDRALDGRTVSALSVFLKLDGQRLPVTVRYDGISRRILVTPTVVLQLQRTYTVEFSTTVHGLDGTPIPAGLFFQFTTNSLRRVVYDYPVPGSLEGPVVTFGWGGTQGPTNNLMYEVYAATDSAAVETRTTPYLQRHVFTRFVPSTRWPMGQRVFWAVTVENLTTHERENGPVQAFQVLDASTPMDSVRILANDFGGNDVRVRNTQLCTSVNFPCGPSYNSAIHWAYAPLGQRARIASVTLRMVMQDAFAGTLALKQPAVWMSQNEWTPCAFVTPGPPFNEPSGFLSASEALSPTEVLFGADRLAAFMEAQYRVRTLITGMVFRGVENVTFHSPLAADPNNRPSVTVRFYRLPPGAQP